MEGLDSTMIAVAIPDMAESLGESPLRLNLVITTYLLSLAGLHPGQRLDRRPARRARGCSAPRSLIFADRLGAVRACRPACR